MEKLLNNSNVNDAEIKKFILKVTSSELAKLSEPCYYPALGKYRNNIYKMTGITNDFLVKWIKDFYGPERSKWLILKDRHTNLMFFLMYYFLKKRDKKMLLYVMLYHVIRTYGNLMYKQITYCNPNVFKYALDVLTKTHLFQVHKTIANALFYLAKELVRKHESKLKDPDPIILGKIIQETRHRISQSVKSFAGTYYKAHEKGTLVRTTPEDDEGKAYQDILRSSKSVEDTVQKLTIYKTIDRKALDNSKKLTKINSNIANKLTKNVSNPKYSDNVRIILDLFIKDIKEVKYICGVEYIKYILKLMALKRTKKKLYFKEQITTLTELLLKDEKNINYFKTSQQKQHSIKLFLSFYLTMSMRNMIC